MSAVMGLQSPDETFDVENATTTDTEDGGVIVNFDKPTVDAAPLDFQDNLVSMLTEQEQTKLANDIVTWTDDDERSREDWRRSYARGLKLLGLKWEERTTPWQGACGAFHPLMLESVIRFQAQAMTETFPASGPVKTEIVGRQTDAKDRKAARIKQDMNYLTTTVMTGYREETEMMLFNLALAGTTFRKFKFDRRYKRPSAEYVLPEHLVMPATATSIETSDFTHIMPRTTNQVKSDMATGLYVEAEIGDGIVRRDLIKEERDKIDGVKQTANTRGHLHYLYERHVEYYFDWDPLNTEKIPLPYICTVDKASNKLLGIRRNWREQDATRERIQHVVQHKYMPGFGAYGIGLINILGGLTESATSILRQLIDSGTLANMPAGYKLKGLRIKDDKKPFAPGVFKDVDLSVGNLRDGFFPLPFKEPSAVLQALLGNVVDEGRRIGSVADMKVTDMSAQNMPVGTTLAIIERTMKVMAAVQARLHQSFKREFQVLAGIVKDFMGDEPYPFELDDRDKQATRKTDYGDEGGQVNVIPVSDPNASTQAQRIMVMQAIQQLAVSAPQIYDMPEVHRMMIRVLGDEDNVDRYIPRQEEIQPRDPVTENMDLLNSRPVRAGISQDHESHIKVHMDAVEDPALIRMLENNPMAGQILAAAAAHIMEHVAYQYRVDIERELGVPLPPPGEPLPEDVEYELSRLVAAAGEKLLGRHQAEEQSKKVLEAMEDPLVQLQRKELEIKEDNVRNDFTVALAKIAQQREALDHKTAETIFTEANETARTILATEVQTATRVSNEQIEGARIGAKLATDMGGHLLSAASSKAKIVADKAKPKRPK